jgi:hypothetical protein
LSSPIVSIRESYLLILSPYASFFTHSRNHCTARPTHALFHSAPIHTSLHSLIPLSFHSRPRNPCALCTTVIVSLLHTFCHFYCHTQSFFHARSARTTHTLSFACCTLNTRVQHSPVRAFCHCIVLSLLALNIPTYILLRRVFSLLGLSFSLLPRASSP